MLWPHHVVLIIQTLLEARIDRPRPPHTSYHVTHKMPFTEAYSFPSMNGTKIVVSPEDKHLADNYKWRISSSGYVVSSVRRQGEYKLTYLHKLVAGTTAKHINSNRLDNRRTNLVETKSRKRIFDQEFKINTVAPILDHTLVPSQAPNKSGHATVRYDNGKLYRGSFQNYKPHGFGMLLEDNDECTKSSTGKWVDGILKWGIVVVFKQIPFCWRVGLEEREIHYVYQVN